MSSRNLTQAFTRGKKVILVAIRLHVEVIWDRSWSRRWGHVFCTFAKEESLLPLGHDRNDVCKIVCFWTPPLPLIPYTITQPLFFPSDFWVPLPSQTSFKYRPSAQMFDRHITADEKVKVKEIKGEKGREGKDGLVSAPLNCTSLRHWDLGNMGAPSTRRRRGAASGNIWGDAEIDSTLYRVTPAPGDPMGFYTRKTFLKQDTWFV